ncbi:unnamed protein product [Arabidopsis thaliana]|uniref:(thale cress) hypothetical protein n=1 Tax=Arabidopsis thaliana TaxID=3702 RepID=A0A7G2DY84_ARATH|nr:unnamed protein product [Arabidopsis thaliana]
MTEAQFLGGDYSEKDKLACVSGFFGGQAKFWFHKELSWIPFNSWSQVKDGLLLTFGNNRDKKRVLMELDLEIKHWIKDFDRKREAHKFLESEAIVNAESVFSHTSDEPYHPSRVAFAVSFWLSRAIGEHMRRTVGNIGFAV